MEAQHGTDAVVTRLCDLIKKGEAGVIFEIDGARVQTPEQAHVVISTCHRAKGMEWPAVQIWDDFKSIDKLNKRYNSAARKSQRAAELVLEEWNILYVAVTRAINRVALPENMDHPEGAVSDRADWVDFDRRVRLEFRGTQLSSDGDLLVMRELDDALGLSALAATALCDPRNSSKQKRLDRIGHHAEKTGPQIRIHTVAVQTTRTSNLGKLMNTA